MEETAKKRRWWPFIVALIVFLVVAFIDSARYGWDCAESIGLPGHILEHFVACVEGLLLFTALVCAIKGKKKTSAVLAIINLLIALLPLLCLRECMGIVTDLHVDPITNVVTVGASKSVDCLPLVRLTLVYSCIFAFVSSCVIAYNFTKAEKIWKVAPIIFTVLGVISIIATLVLSCYVIHYDGSMTEQWTFPDGFLMNFEWGYTAETWAIGSMVYPISIGLLYFLLAAGMSVTRSEKTEKPATANPYTACTAEGYVDLVKMVLLSMFTFGIWPLIWIYRTTKKLNEAKCVEYYEPVNKLLLCIFVPFYQIYWYYKHGQRVDALAREKKLKVPLLDTPCLILGIFMPFVASALIQDRINMICMAPESAPEAVAAPVDSGNNADAIKKYKELLDIGAITQEEFDAKKKQLLGL